MIIIRLEIFPFCHGNSFPLSFYHHLQAISMERLLRVASERKDYKITISFPPDCSTLSFELWKSCRWTSIEKILTAMTSLKTSFFSLPSRGRNKSKCRFSRSHGVVMKRKKMFHVFTLPTSEKEKSQVARQQKSKWNSQDGTELVTLALQLTPCSGMGWINNEKLSSNKYLCKCFLLSSSSFHRFLS